MEHPRQLLGLGLGVGLGFFAFSLQLRKNSKNQQAKSRKHSGNLQVTERVANSKPILIKEIASEVGNTIAAGHSVINLSQGVPCLPIFEAAAKAMQDTYPYPFLQVKFILD